MSDHDPYVALARADLCRFLSACHYQPSVEFEEEQMFDSMVEAAARIDPDLAARARALAEAFVEQELQELLIDYTRLFLGPVDALAKPYGSVWLERARELMQDSTMDVRALYRAGGFELAEDFHELPDHVAVELEFLYVLIFRAGHARIAGDAEGARRVEDLKRTFLERHLARWVGAFAEACTAGAQTRFYRELGALTARFVARETTL